MDVLVIAIQSGPQKNDEYSKNLKMWIEEIMYIIINVFCKNCSKEGRIHVKQDETKLMIEENHFCPHCNVKGKLSTVRQ